MYREDGKFLFDPVQCPDCLEMMRSWEEEQHYQEVLEQYKSKYQSQETKILTISRDLRVLWTSHPNPRLLKDPRDEKRKDYRRKRRGWQYHHQHEETKLRKHLNRRFRRKMKTLDHVPTTREYKTYGWMTW
ncbi:hypothetical protein IMZ31_22380 (plasmid) [Pontibacillus sp. ALD_SL1]|uniref:hypothetical protein n=1 Tax=Pontibacillus sp. ALD_SL1 TaxID=2777185 RepID=UPI001A978FEB|nr:hypothetical protein [Pontibacillus sp. ALD_SL1]QST02203.1 hypothetical protein IMZ31_22380 [Pontibacillus sp. ALD_SL1]